MNAVTKILARKETAFISGVPAASTLAWSILDPSVEAYSAFASFGILFLFSLVIRKQTNNEQYYELLKANLNQIEKQFKSLKPFTALDQLIVFNDNFDSSKLDESSRNKILAKFHFLNGQCLIEASENKNQGFEELIKAYKLATSDLIVKERAITSFFHLGQISEAQKISREVLDKDPNNARAWVLKVVTESNYSTDNVPVNVLKKTEFKFILTSILIKKQKVEEAAEILKVDIDELNNEVKIKYENFHYYLQITFFLYTSFFNKNTLYVDPKKNQFLVDHPELKRIQILLNKILDLYGRTELFINNPYYKQAKVFSNFIEYYLDRSKTAILENFKILSEGFKYATNGMVMQLSICLADLDESDKLISIYNHEKYKDSQDLSLVLAEYHSKNGRPRESLEYYANYLNKIENS